MRQVRGEASTLYGNPVRAEGGVRTGAGEGLLPGTGVQAMLLRAEGM